MATLTVGTSKQFATIAAATAAAHDGDTVAVSAGTYLNDFATIKSKITLVAVGGTVTMKDTATMASGQALLTVNTDATINGFVLTGAHATDGTASGLLVQGGALTLQNSLVANNQNGLVSSAAAPAATSVLIQRSEFAANGNNDGFSHNISVGAIKSLTIQDSYIHDAAGGHEVRSLAQYTTITGTRIADNAAAALNAIALPNGGTVVLQNDTIEKGARSTLPAAIQFGGGTVMTNSSLTASGNVFVADRSGAIALKNQTTQAASLSANTLYGFTTPISGLGVVSANIVPVARPAISTTSLIAAAALPVEYGRTGAVIANGAILTVGAGGAYATLSAALAAAHDGDTIDVAAGTYLNDTATITHKVIIEGIGGPVRFVDTIAPANGAQFTTTTDVTFRNIEIFGVSTPGGVAAAIHATAGNLTIVNSTIHDNQAGIVADAGAGAVGIYDTSIASNGTADGRGGNIQVAAIGTLTLRNDVVKNAIAGPEISSAAANTTIDATRISQVQGNGAADIALPDGGTVSITNSAIEKGANSATTSLIQVGGSPISAAAPAVIYAGSTVTLANDTLISDLTTAPTTFVANAASSVVVAATNTTFAGGATGSVQVQNGTNTGAITSTANLAVNTTDPFGATAAPAPAPLLAPIAPPPGAPQSGQLILRVSEAAFHGDAQFTLTVDGAPVAGTLTATASHAAGQSQTFTIAGAYAPGPHTVAVKFLNSLTDGSGAARALYVDGMTFNGQDTAQTAALPANGTAMLSTAPNTHPTAVTVNLSEDAWHGDALAFISIDGKVQGGVQTITASHGAGATQGMSFLVDLAPGAHTAAVTFLNPASGAAAASRSLYIDSIDVAGQHYAAAATTIDAGGTSSYAFTAPPPAVPNGALFVTAGFVQQLAPIVPTP